MTWENNKLELSDFIESLTVDEFLKWVYRLYSVSAEEQKEIEESYEDES